MKSFRDPTTGVLKAWGYVESNDAGDIVREEPDDFALTPGMWRLVDDQWLPFTRNSFTQKTALLRIRDARKPVLDALTGIAGRAQRAGNTTVAAEADALSQALLDVTKAPTVVAAFMAQDDEAVDHAVLAYYRTQAAAASPAVQSAFNEIAT